MTAAGIATEEGRRVALAISALVLGALAMGASVLFVRWADVGPFASAFWRVFLALPFLWAWTRIEARPMGGAPLWSDRAVLLAGLLFTGDLFFWHLAILGTTVANATFLATTAPIWVALGAWLVLSEAVGRRVLIGLALCTLGGFALLGESYGFVPQRLIGDLYGLATAVFFGCYVLAVRAARTLEDKVVTYADAMARVLPRTVPLVNALREAGATDPDCAAQYTALVERRAANMRLLAADLRATGEVRGDLTDDEVADLVWTLNGPEWFGLVTSRGRTPEQYAELLADVLVRTLRAEAVGGAHP